MKITKVSRRYAAPTADVCEDLTDAVLCQSSDLAIDDWEQDDVTIDF